MKRLITLCIVFVSVSLAAQDTIHLPNIVNYYYREMNFLNRDQSQKDSIDPIEASMEQLDILMQSKNLFTRSIAKRAMLIMEAAVMQLPTQRKDTISMLLNDMLAGIAQEYGRQSTLFAEGLLWCAHECVKKGDNKQGRELLRQGTRLLRRYGNGAFDGRDTLIQIFYLDVLSKIEYNSERDYQAVLYTQQVCALKKAFFGEHSEVYFNALLDLSNLYAERRQHRKANYYHNLGYTAYVERIKSAFCATSESERAIFWEKAKKYVNKTINVAHKMSGSSQEGNEHSLGSAAYNALLLSKGLLLNTSNSFDNYIYSSGNEEAINILQEKKELTTKQVPQRVLDSLDYAILDALHRKGQTFELPLLSIRWEDVAAQLEPNDLAIEFYKTDQGQYGAILLKHDWKSPKVIRLKYQPAMNVDMERYYSEQGRELWQLSHSIWKDEIVQYFPPEGNGRIFFSADGELQMMGIEYMPFIAPDKDGKFYCFTDVYPMSRLSSTREIVIWQNNRQHTTATLYGGIQYTMDTANLLAESEKYEAVACNRGLADDTLNRGSIAYLKGTKKEVEQISTMLKDNSLNVQLFTATQANEESFKSLSGKNQNILHIATHGFFWTNTAAQKKEFFTQRGSSSGEWSSGADVIDPLNRCGLLFAGAQMAWSGHSADLPKGVQDGILTAKEISLLDLREADLVVLSACETGKGEISGDGVFGLQRAFKMAGANTIIMSLWPVNDAATQMLMTEFYKNWINLHQSKREAFYNAQHVVRSEFEEPVYWAGFVLLD